MELASNHFQSLNRDLVVNIMTRLHGRTLAAVASTCIDLRDAAEDERLWRKLCHDMWPSTSMRLLPMHKPEGFKRLYISAFPLILYQPTTKVPEDIPTCTTPDSPSDFISFIDIYYKNLCIFSQVVDGLTESTSKTCNDNFKQFFCFPFKLDWLGQRHSTLPSSVSLGHEDQDNLCNKIVGNIRLSWILYDKTKSRAVNISSWKPRSIDRSNPSEQSFIICFGSAITSDHTLAECVITAKCEVMIRQECVIRWKGITLVIKDVNGSHLNGEQSMIVVKQALFCSRSVNHDMVELGYKEFCKKKVELKLRDEEDETLANMLSATIAIASLLGICYACATLL
ncbi:hypothetical protein CDL12_29897 [Handroanthus impetiginosus]|uniref:F-box domain-containing protein n=1 Tax=Handroanthus impetiginosus TaxID=429701 RepID=A0A2G9FX47_9LAMI|nr:hypothetical protein CDL12_29897 [Handroanthus impetiginosus]